MIWYKILWKEICTKCLPFLWCKLHSIGRNYDKLAPKCQFRSIGQTECKCIIKHCKLQSSPSFWTFRPQISPNSCTFRSQSRHNSYTFRFQISPNSCTFRCQSRPNSYSFRSQINHNSCHFKSSPISVPVYQCRTSSCSSRDSGTTAKHFFSTVEREHSAG